MGRSKPRTNKRPPPKRQPLDPQWSTSLPQLTHLTDPHGTLAIDLPASLAALFEAKLTLDREKAKLMRMQKELKGYREGVAAVSKGKEAAEELDCACGRHSPAPSFEECYSECCSCSCHYVECDHEGECDCEEEHVTDDQDNLSRHHHLDYGDHDHDYDHHTCNPQPITVPNPYLPHSPNTTQMTYQQALEAYRDERDNAARGLDEIGGMFKAAGWPQPSQKPLSEDPERLDEAVRELFNWIKAVVWTIEQAAIVAGRRNWQ